jgi:hypothetical protein
MQCNTIKNKNDPFRSIISYRKYVQEHLNLVAYILNIPTIRLSLCKDYKKDPPMVGQYL